MTQDRLRLAPSSLSMSVRTFAAASERVVPAFKNQPNRWPFTVERSGGPVCSPAADSPPVTRMQASHFIS